MVPIRGGARQPSGPTPGSQCQGPPDIMKSGGFVKPAFSFPIVASVASDATVRRPTCFHKRASCSQTHSDPCSRVATTRQGPLGPFVCPQDDGALPPSNPHKWPPFLSLEGADSAGPKVHPLSVGTYFKLGHQYFVSFRVAL